MSTECNTLAAGNRNASQRAQRRLFLGLLEDQLARWRRKGKRKLPDLILRVHGENEIFVIFPRPDEFICAGIKCVIENENALNETFNITYGKGRTIAEMSEIIKANFTGIKVKYEPKDSLTPDRGTLIIDKARKMIGYDPQYPLEKGYVEYIKWYKSFYKENYA